MAESLRDPYGLSGSLTSFTQFTPDLIVISGPSAVGKDTLLQRLRDQGSKFELIVTVTTRYPRVDEQDGKDYTFVSQAQFDEMKANGDLIEHAEVYGNFYGIPRSSIERALSSGHDAILRVGPTGLSTIRNLYPNAVAIFIAPENLEELRTRIYRRTGGTSTEAEKRLADASADLALAGDFDYIVINRTDKLDETVQNVKAIIIAEKLKVKTWTRNALRLIQESTQGPTTRR